MSTPRRTVVAAPPRRTPAELRTIRVVVEPDLDPDVTFLREKGLEERRASFEQGEFGFVGTYIEADVIIEGTEQTLTSPGMWGVESDLSEEELDQIVDEEWRALRPVLKTIGVATEELPLAAEREWRK